VSFKSKQIDIPLSSYYRFMSLNILVTGSSGFLGSLLCKVLVKKGHNLTAVDLIKPINLIPNTKYFVDSLDTFLVNNSDTLSSFDIIIHTASVLPFKSNKNQLIETNINITKKLIDAIEASDSTFLIYVSSSGVYGKPKSLPINIDTELNPLDLYAKTKIKSEEYIKNNLDSNQYSIIRPRTILGENRGGIFNLFFSLIKKNIPIPLPNNGKQIIQFVDVEDLANLITYVGENKLFGIWPAAAPQQEPLKNHLKKLGVVLNKKVITFNINSKFFEFFGNTLVKLKLTNFTNWHFGAFPHDFYFDENWKPEGFKYNKTCNDTFMNSADSYFNKDTL
jgi:nucleoside-diphosphate-sugar epimerase